MGVAYQLRALARARAGCGSSAGTCGSTARVMLHLVRVSVGGIVQFLIATASWLGLVRILTPFGAAALAGYTIAIRIIIFAILPSWGLTNAAATLVGQNLGRAASPSARSARVWLTGLYNMVFLVGVMAVFLCRRAEPLIARLHVGPRGARARRRRACGSSATATCFYAWGMVHGAGVQRRRRHRDADLDQPLLLLVFQIPLALRAGARARATGPTASSRRCTVAESALAVVGLLVFRRGSWKRQEA